MSKNTCGGCPHLQIKDIWRGMYTASCGLTDDELIVPHSWNGDKGKVVLHRVPEFCENPDKIKSKNPVPVKDRVTIYTKNL